MPHRPNVTTLLKQLTSIVPHVRRGSPLRSAELSHKYGDIAFDWQGGELLHQTIDAFWSADPELHNTLDRRVVEQDIVALLQQRDGSSTPLSTRDVDALLAGWRARPARVWTVLRTLHGAILRPSVRVPWFPRAWRVQHDWRKRGQPRRHLRTRLRRTTQTIRPHHFGPFTIYDPVLHHDLLMQALPAAWHDQVRERLTRLVHAHPPALIAVQVTARDAARAQVLADVLFTQFENAVRYMVAPLGRHYDVGIFDPDDGRVLDHIAFGTEPYEVASGWSIVGRRELVDLTLLFFHDASLGHDKVWAMISARAQRGATGDALADRLLSAVTWIGKGVRDLDPGRQFVQYLFALEALFTARSADVPVSNRLAEYAAFTLGTTTAERIEIAAETKALYGKRSAIAHGRTDAVTEGDVRSALTLTKRLVARLLTDPRFIAMTTMAELEQWMIARRYE